MTKLKGHFKGENDYFIEGYKAVNEPAEKELYIYKFDPDSENYEHYDIMPMPDFWKIIFSMLLKIIR